MLRRLRISNMADAGVSSSRMDIKGFEFIPLHEYISDNEKVSRKKHILNYSAPAVTCPRRALFVCFMGDNFSGRGTNEPLYGYFG